MSVGECEVDGFSGTTCSMRFDPNMSFRSPYLCLETVRAGFGTPGQQEQLETRPSATEIRDQNTWHMY